MKFTRMFIYLIIVFVLFPANSVWAVRPFITDDARVTPAHTFLTETSLRMDSNRYQNLTLFALGVTSKLEATVGFTDGVLVKDDGGQTWQMSAAGPLVQMKYLFKEQKGVDGFPAVGIAAGIAPPWGVGAKNFAPEALSEFAFLIVSKTFSTHPERLNLHVNIGATNNHLTAGMKQDFTWGLGLQYLLYRDIVFGVTELVSGDPYGVSKGAIYQVGLRFFISDQMQLDVSYGSGIYGDPLPGGFFGFGFRFFTDPLW